MLLHAPLLRLPYFWDEAGYYVPAARDLYLTGTLIPQSTPSNAHPPLVMAWLALAWRVAGYSTLVTRTAMLALAAFSLLGLFRLSRVAANRRWLGRRLRLAAIYPVFFTQSSLAQVDLPAAGFTFWALLAYLEDVRGNKCCGSRWRPGEGDCDLGAAGAVWMGSRVGIVASDRRRWPELATAGRRRTRSSFAAPVVPLACWYAYHYAKTGFLFGNPEFFRYNVAATLDPLRIPLAFVLRLWQVCGYFGLYLLTLAGLLAMLRRRRKWKRELLARELQSGNRQPSAAVLLAYLVFMSAVGGAVLARYLLPVVPLVILAWVSTLWRRARYWKLIVGAVAIAFVAGLFTNPPYGFSLEDNLAYRDYIVMHAEASRFLLCAIRTPVCSRRGRPRMNSLVPGWAMSRARFMSCASRTSRRRRSNWPPWRAANSMWRSSFPPSISRPIRSSKIGPRGNGSKKDSLVTIATCCPMKSPNVSAEELCITRKRTDNGSR